MKALVGLGNPGADYEATRHNLGFRVADVLVGPRREEAWQREGSALVQTIRVAGARLLVAKPQTFMNRSGVAVAELEQRHQLGEGDLLVAHDELDLPLGCVRLKRGGGHGGHRGIESILEQGQVADFVRIRMGIKPAEEREDAAEFVLSPFAADEQGVAQAMVKRAAEAVRAILVLGTARAMTEINRRDQ